MPITHATIPVPPDKVTATEWAEAHTLPDASEISAATVTIEVRKSTGVTIPKGSAVYISVSQGANLPRVSLAKADALATSRTIGLVQADIANNATGHSVVAQKIEISPPANDVCSGTIAVTPGTWSFSSVGSFQDGSASCGGGSDVWFQFTAYQSGTLVAHTCGTNDLGGVDQGMDTVLSLHSQCIGTPAHELPGACNDDWSSSSVGRCGNDAGLPRDSIVQASVTAGQTVIIRVARYAYGSNGPFQLSLSFTANGSGPTPDQSWLATSTLKTGIIPLVDGRHAAASQFRFDFISPDVFWLHISIVYLSYTLYASVQVGILMWIPVLTAMKQKRDTARHVLYQKDEEIPPEWKQVEGPAGGVFPHQKFELFRKVPKFPFMVYWRHYGRKNHDH